MEGDRHQKGHGVGDRLAELHAQKSQKPGQDQDQGHIKDPLPAARQKCGAAAPPQALEHLVDVGGIAQHGQHGAQHPQRPGPHGDDLRIVPPEQGQKLRGKQRDARRRKTGHCRPQRRGEPKGRSYPLGDPRAVVIARHWLKALSDAHQDRADKEIDPVGDAHGGHRRVAEARRRHVEQRGGQAGKALPEQRGRAHADDGEIVRRPAADVAPRNAQGALLFQKEIQQHAEADALADHGGQRRASRPQAEGEDQQRIQRHVEQVAAGDAQGRKGRPPLAFHGDVKDKGGAHNGRARQDIPGVGAGIGQNGVGGAQKPHERLQKQQPEQAQKPAEHQRHHHRGGNVAAGALAVLLPQLAGDHAPRPHADGKPHRLNEALERKDHANRRRCAGAELRDEIRIGDVVNGGDHHPCHGGQGQRRHKPGDGGLGHAGVLLPLGQNSHAFPLFFGQSVCKKESKPRRTAGTSYAISASKGAVSIMCRTRRAPR